MGIAAFNRSDDEFSVRGLVRVRRRLASGSQA